LGTCGRRPIPPRPESFRLLFRLGPPLHLGAESGRTRSMDIYHCVGINSSVGPEARRSPERRRPPSSRFSPLFFTVPFHVSLLFLLSLLSRYLSIYPVPHLMLIFSLPLSSFFLVISFLFFS